MFQSIHTKSTLLGAPPKDHEAFIISLDPSLSLLRIAALSILESLSNKTTTDLASIFTKIIRREIPAYILAEDAHNIAFLDIRPMAPGHTLVVPKQEVDNFFDLDDEALAQSMLFAKKVAKPLQETVSCLRVGLAVVGLEVPHAHIHLVPLNAVEEIDFSRPRQQVSPEALGRIASQIRTRIVL